MSQMDIPLARVTNNCYTRRFSAMRKTSSAGWEHNPLPGVNTWKISHGSPGRQHGMTHGFCGQNTMMNRCYITGSSSTPYRRPGSTGCPVMPPEHWIYTLMIPADSSHYCQRPALPRTALPPHSSPLAAKITGQDGTVPPQERWRHTTRINRPCSWTPQAIP